MDQFMRVAVFTLAVLLSGCAGNPYQEFYRAYPGLEAPQSLPAYDPSGGELLVYTTSDFAGDTLTLMEQGYWPVGEASFSAGASLITDRNLRAQAAAIGAHAVLISTEYSHTVSGGMPMSVPKTSTTYSSGTATAYGSGGSVTAYGSGTSTTYSSDTVVVPFSVDRYNAGARYFVKVRHSFGVLPMPLDNEARRALGSNRGLWVTGVVQGSPAFFADIVPGDIVLSLNGEPVYAIEQLRDLQNALVGQMVDVEVMRDGERMTIPVRFAEIANVPAPADANVQTIQLKSRVKQSATDR